MTTSAAIAVFDQFEVTTPFPKLYNVVGDLLDVATRSSPLYYVNHFQYRHGSIFRAIMGKQVFWDKQWEERIVKTLDKLYHDLIDGGHYQLECWKSVLPYALSIRGFKWVNGQKPKIGFNPKPPRAKVVINPGTVIYVRIDDERVDIEGVDQFGLELVVTTQRKYWDHLKTGFEVKGNHDGKKGRFVRHYPKNHDALSSVREAPRTQVDEETAEPL